MIRLRGYQQECLDSILKLDDNKRVCVKAPTGSGKTIIMAGLVHTTKDSDERILIVVPSTELREQTIDKIETLCGKGNIDIGSVQASLDEVGNKVVVATRQSLTHSKSNRINRMKEYGDFDYVLIDECHQACFQQEKIIKSLENNKTKFVGFTATPYNDDMTKVYSEIIFKRGILDMIDMHYLVEPRCKLVYSNTDISTVKTVAGEFNLGQLEECLNNGDRNQLIVDAYNEFAKDRNKTLIFATGIDHCNEICECFNRNGIKAYSLDSNDTKDDREKILKDFNDNKIKVLVNIGILTTGFDQEDLDTIILARPTKSKMLYEQIIGRGLRLHQTKKDCLSIDVVDIARKHNIMSLSDVFDIDINDGETPTEAKERIKHMAEEERMRLEEEKRLREEEIRKQQELVAQEIELFNSSMRNILYFSVFDWFRFDDNTYSLYGDMGNAIVIKKDGDNVFLVYSCKVDKYLSLSEEYTTNNLQDAIRYSENVMLEFGTSFMKKNSRWKFDKATENQMKYVHDSFKKYVNTKWDVNKYFFNRKLFNALKYAK